jgi:hypothetical protein
MTDDYQVSMWAAALSAQQPVGLAIVPGFRLLTHEVLAAGASASSCGQPTHKL